MLACTGHAPPHHPARMTNNSSISGRIILRGQAVGFSALLVIMWVVEFLRLPHYLFGESPDIIWTRILSRTAVLLTIWLIVHLTTRRLLRRLHELEEFLRLCSWCRKVDHEGNWVSIEEYFDTKFATGTSHGICPDCARQVSGPRVARVERTSA